MNCNIIHTVTPIHLPEQLLSHLPAALPVYWK